MNTKKITALALAALMAAGSTSTVFAAVASADKDKVLEFADPTGKTYYEENDDGLLVKDKDGVAPGESVYFLLQDNTGVSGIEDKDRDRIKVYADWKMGKDYIKDIDVIYDKGNFQSNSNSQVTGYKYTFKAGKPVEAVTIPGAKLDNTALQQNDAVKAAITKAYTVKEGYTHNQQYYKTADALVKAMNGTYTSSQTVYRVVEGKNHADADIVNLLKDAGFEKLAGSNLYVGTGEETKGYGSYTEIQNNNTTFNGDKSAVYINKTTGKFVDTASGKIDSIADFEGTAAQAVGVTLEKTTTGFNKGSSYFWDNNEVVKDAVKEKTAEEVSETASVLVGKDGSTVMDIDAAIAEVFGTSPAAEEVRGAKDGYTYWVKIDTKESFTTKEQDIAGTLYLGTSKNSAEDKGSKLEIGLPLSNRIDDNNGSYVIKDGDTIYPDANGAVKFEDDAEEVTIYFGSNEDAWFTFNAAGQGALNLAYNTKFNKEIADLFPKANIDFISWIAEPATNRTGDLYITAEEDTFLYQVTEDGKGIKEVKGADYDEDEGAWHIRTRKLGSYVISDIELDTSVKVEGKDDASSNSSTSSKPNGDKHNPDTGR